MFNIKNKFELEKTKKFSNKIAKTNYFNAIKNLQHTIIDFNYSISLLFSTTNVNHFKFSIIHNNNIKSKTSKQLKNFAHFVETFMQNEFVIFQHSKTTIEIVLFFLRIIKIQNTNSMINNLIERRFQQKHNKKFSSKNHMTISIKTRDLKIAWMQYNDLNKHFFNDFDRFIFITKFHFSK